MNERPFDPRAERPEIVELVHEIGGSSNRIPPGFFAADRALVIACAPGRLDLMGGIADYSGSLVLQLPIAEGTVVAAQARRDEDVWVLSPGEAGALREFRATRTTLAELADGTDEEARAFFRADPATSWAAYVAGVLLVLAREETLPLDRGWRILVDSSVPEGKGVSSSAALEVATMSAVSGFAEPELGGAEIAALCRRVENDIVGSPCGIMDQMACALGRQDQLLELLCRPAEVRGFRPLPPSLAVWGIDSGIRRSVSGSEYVAVRTGAFMGARILAEHAASRSHLTELTPAEFAAHEAGIPERMSGAEFMHRHGEVDDPVTSVDPRRTYAVRASTAHPIHEHARVQRFAHLLRGDLERSSREELGRIMLASHRSYTACGLGSEGTELLVDLVLEAGPARGLYGARVTGGGCGGTVAILGDADARDTVRAVATEYARRTAHETSLFTGSSPGACEFGRVRLGG